MYTVKENSTHEENRKAAINACPVSYTLERIGGRWKAQILFHLSQRAMRYAELKRAVGSVTEKMLIQQLKELENDKLVIRDVKPVVPPHVTYSLTQAGKELAPVMYAMAQWGLKYREDKEYNEMCTLGV
jgi:DNA-binding HxlR family transcriptional regulator